MENNHFKKRSKFGNKKTGAYDSKKESKRAGDLKMLLLAGEISDLREQIKFELIPKQIETYEVQLKTKYITKERCLEQACHYIADFVYIDKNGDTVVEDSKGFRTPDYKIKRKLMLYVHGIKIKET